MVLQFRNKRFPNPAGLVAWVERHKDQGVKLRPDHKLAVVRELTNAQRIVMARKVVGALKKVAEKA